MKILIIDDSKEFRALVRLYLLKEMEDVELVEYAVEGIGKPADDYQWSDYDILLLDYNLGGDEDGFDWLQKFQHKDGFPPTIVLTAEGDEYIAVKAIKLGAADYINKADITPKLLVDAIRSVIYFASESTDIRKADIKNVSEVVEKIYRKDHGDITSDRLVFGYKIVRKIDQGSMSKVYLVERENSEQIFALKVLDIKNSSGYSVVERFVLEAELISALDSPFVVKIYEHGLTDDYGFIVMEFLSRGDLKQRMDAYISPESAVTYLMQIASGLDAIHEAGIMHRDLKPANIMFRGDDSLVLADFGISKKIDSNKQLTTMGQVMGTPNYMSPEQGEGKVVDIRTDLYSAGIIFYKLLTGERPFIAADPVSLIYKHVHEKIPRLAEHLERFQEIIEKLMAKKPKDRYSSARELMQALKPFE